MNNSQSHDDAVTAQFGPRAEAYLTSAVHARGPDLDELEGIARAHAGGRALDLGCGGGHVAYRLSPIMESVTACDLSPEMLSLVQSTARARALTNVSTRQARAEALPFEAAAFSFVATRFSAHHWTSLAAGLAEARRVVAPGATAVVIDAAAPHSVLLDTHLQAIELLRDPSHVRDYTLREWIAAMEHAGFEIRSARRSRLHIDFSSWVQRMNAPPPLVEAIRTLQAGAPAEVREYFQTAADGSFELDVVLLEGRAA